MHGNGAHLERTKKSNVPGQTITECVSSVGGYHRRVERHLVSSQQRTYEIRCPVHGFIPFNDWEREIIQPTGISKVTADPTAGLYRLHLPRSDAHPIRAFPGRDAHRNAAIRCGREKFL